VSACVNAANRFQKIPLCVPVLPLQLFVPGLPCGDGFIQILLIPALILMITNFAITMYYSWRITPYFTGLSQIVTMLGVSEKLAAIADGSCIAQLDICGRRSRWLPGYGNAGWLVIDRKALPIWPNRRSATSNVLPFRYLGLSSLARGLPKSARWSPCWKRSVRWTSSIAVASYLQSLHALPAPRWLRIVAWR